MQATKERDIQAVKELKLNDRCYIAWSEEGGGEVYHINDYYILFSIPQYGGNPRFEGVYHDSHPEKVVDEAWSWT